MIEHIVLFRFRAEASASTKMDFLQALRTLKDEIPSLADLSAGNNFCPRSKGYEMGLVARFQTETDLAAYQTHPAHQAFLKNWVQPHTEEVLAVDYQF